MAHPKDILVITTSSVEGIKIKRYLKPISAHIVAGTNIFNDFLGSLSDVFGGRSQAYQKQLMSLYNEAIERIKISAYEIGANCIIGVTIDMDEISGKGKSMFMITATGTAVILEKDVAEKTPLLDPTQKLHSVGVDKINILRNKKSILKKALADDLVLNDDFWDFIIINQIAEIAPYLLKKYLQAIEVNEETSASYTNYHNHFTSYIDALPDDIKLDILYTNIQTAPHEQLTIKLAEIIDELKLFDFNRVMQLLKSDNFQKQKIGLQIAKYDKPFYSKEDVLNLQTIKNYSKEIFGERGTRSMKKQLLSSKEKEVWTCECGKTNDMDTNCSGCSKDIYGFKSSEEKPSEVDKFLQEKIELISEYIV